MGPVFLRGATAFFLAVLFASTTDACQCDNSCPSSSNGVCDDGGPGSTASSCGIGTDCNDCGPSTRSALANGATCTQSCVCDNSCIYSSDGSCDDQGPGSVFNDCLLGTDCDDCGPSTRPLGGGTAVGGTCLTPNPTGSPSVKVFTTAPTSAPSLLACAGTYTEMQGVYVSIYTSPTTFLCRFHIDSATHLSFTTFDLEASDELRIVDGLTMDINHPGVQVFGGGATPPDQIGISGQFTVFWVKNTNFVPTTSGWNFQIVTQSPTPFPTLSPTQGPSGPNCVTGYTIEPDGRTYKSVYNLNMNCRWVIFSSKLIFSKFKVENGYDFLYVYPGNNQNFLISDPLVHALTGNGIPADIESMDGFISLYWFTDFTVTRKGWTFFAVSAATTSPTITQAPSTAPTTLSPITLAPTIPTRFLSANSKFQLGGPKNYSGPTSIPVVAGVLNHFVGDINSTLTCFTDIAAIQPADVNPWVINGASAANYDSDGLRFRFERLLIDFSPSCGYFSPSTELRIINCTILYPTYGFRVTLSSSLIMMSSVRVTSVTTPRIIGHPSNGIPPPQLTTSLLSVTSGGEGTEIEVSGGIFQNLAISATLIVFETSNVTFKMMNTEFVNITGVGGGGSRWLGYPGESYSNDNLPTLNPCTSCNDPCFETENFCGDAVYWKFHATALLSLRSSAFSSLTLRNLKFAQITSLRTLHVDVTSSNVTVTAENVTYVACSLGDTPELAVGGTAQPTISPTLSPTTNPTISPTQSPTPKGSTLAPSVTPPNVTLTVAPTFAPTTTISTGRFFGIIEVYAPSLNISLTNFTYSDDVDSDHNQDNLRTIVYMNGSRSYLSLNYVRISNSQIEAIVRDQCSSLKSARDCFEYSVNSLEISSMKNPGIPGFSPAIFLIVGIPSEEYRVSNLDLRLTNHSLLHSYPSSSPILPENEVIHVALERSTIADWATGSTENPGILGLSTGSFGGSRRLEIVMRDVEISGSSMDYLIHSSCFENTTIELHNLTMTSLTSSPSISNSIENSTAALIRIPSCTANDAPPEDSPASFTNVDVDLTRVSLTGGVGLGILGVKSAKLKVSVIDCAFLSSGGRKGLFSLERTKPLMTVYRSNFENIISGGSGFGSLVTVTGNVEGPSNIKIFNTNVTDSNGESAIHLDESTRLTVNTSRFGRHTGNYGVILAQTTNVALFASEFTNNIAYVTGGVITTRGTLLTSQCTYTNNTGGLGGGIYSEGDSVESIGCVFSSNQAIIGGGDIFAANIKAIDSKFDNSFSLDGGSIWSTSFLEIRECSFQNNTADKGASIYLDRSAGGTIHRGNFSNILASEGTVYMSSDTNLKITESEFRDIISRDAGLVKVGTRAEVTLNDSVVESLFVTGFGGVASVDSYGRLDVVSSKIQNISSTANGGLFYLPNQFSEVYMSSSILSHIKALSGGLVWSLAASISAENCNFTDLSAATTGGVVNAADSSNVVFQKCRFSKLRAQSGALAHLVDTATLQISQNTINNIEVASTAGVAEVSNFAYLEISETDMWDISALAGSGGSVVKVEGNARVELSHVNVWDASAAGGASAGLVSDSGSMNVYNSSFSNCSVGGNTGAGVFTTKKEGKLNISQSSFRRNQADFGGAAVALVGGTVDVRFSQFYQNSVSGGFGGAIYASTKGVVTLHTCSFERNTAVEGGAIYVSGSGGNVTVSNSNFTSNTASKGGAIRSIQQSLVQLETSTFRLNSAGSAGGAISSVSSNLKADGCIFEENSAQYYGGSMFLEDTLDGSIIENSRFYRNKATETVSKGGGLYTSPSATGISVSAVGLRNVNFSENIAASGGAIFWERESSRPVRLGTVAFNGNNAVQGNDEASGPVGIQMEAYNNLLNSRANMSNVSLGVISIGSHELLQGALNLRFIDSYNHTVRYDNSSTFILKVPGVTVSGGSLLPVQGKGCFGLSCNSPTNTFFVSQPATNHSFYVEAYVSTLTDSGESYSIGLNTSISQLRIEGCVVGQTISVTNAICVDCPPGTYQPEIPHSGTICIPCPAGSATSSYRSTMCPECDGIAVTAGSSQCATCQEDYVPNIDHTACQQCATNARGTNNTQECVCVQGYFEYEDEVDELNNPSVCHPCPEGGSCPIQGLKDQSVHPREGYWQDPWVTRDVEFIKCRNEACPGEKGKCVQGYEGVLCTECQEGYGRGASGDFTCVRCGSKLGTAFQMLGSWALVCAIGVGLAYLNVQDAEAAVAAQSGEGEMSSVLTKILINSLQFNLLAASFDYEWPAYLKVILEAQGAAGGVITNLLSTDCLNESNIRPIYINSIMLAFEPFLTPLLALVTVGIVAFVIKRNNEEDGKDEEKAATKAMARRFSVQMRSGKTSVELENLPGSVERALAKADMKFTKRASLEMDILSNEKADKKGSLETQALASTKSGHILPSSIRPDEPEVIALMKELESRRWRSQFYTALLSLNFTAYTAIVLQTFRLFNCDQIGSTSDSVVLLADMNQKCYEGQHLLFMICLGVPMLVLYVLGFPFVCMVFLWRNRKDMPVVLADAPGIGWEERFRRLRKSIKVFLLFHGFKPKYYFWEILIMARKIMIVCFAVFFDSPSLQAASSTLLIVIALGMQLQWKPFSTRMCNHFELYGIITSLVTFFFGQFLYFRINHAFKVFCSVIIVIVNIWFFCFMATRIIQMKIMEYHIRKEKKESQPVFEAMLVDKRDIDPEANGDDKKGRKGGHKRIDSFVPDPISRSASRIRRPNLTRVSSASDLRSVAMWSIYQKRESKRNLHLNSENEASRTEPYQSPARSPVGVSNTSPTESDLLERDRLSLPSGGVASETSRSRVASCRSKKSISRANSPPPGDDKRLRKATSCRELSTSQKARHEKRGRARSASPEGKESPTGEPFLQPKRDSGPPPVEMQNECVSPNGQVTSPQAAESSMVYVSVI